MSADEAGIRVLRGGVAHDATVAWARAGQQWDVTVTCPAFGSVSARGSDAFDALCLVRDELEPAGWRIGVVGAQSDVWPSGMARDQGGGLRAYRLTEEGVVGVVGTFDPADPTTVTTVAEQRAETDRLHDEMGRRSRAN